MIMEKKKKKKKEKLNWPWKFVSISSWFLNSFHKTTTLI